MLSMPADCATKVLEKSKAEVIENQNGCNKQRVSMYFNSYKMDWFCLKGR